MLCHWYALVLAFFEMKNGGLISPELLHEGNCTNGIKWIQDMFTDCVDTDMKLIGFVIGLISLLLWLVPLFPQLWQNYRTKKCEGLSLAFLFFWLAGDTCNMLGAMLTNQQPIQKIIGVYYIIQDLVLWAQYGYYAKIYPRKAQRTGTIVVPCIALASFGSLCLTQFEETDRAARSIRQAPTILNISVLAQGHSFGDALRMWPIFESYTDFLGYIIGSIAALCYFGGRIPQIISNFQRKSCEGLSLTMFYIIVAANFTYGVSVILATTGWIFLLRHLPWIAGSLGCCMFDAVIISQYYYYRRSSLEAADTERQNLLNDEEE